ncbi:MAG: hypothetical protein ACI9HK_002933 [Pirellulaceae bacterium]|jgi:hypothetical protein
MQQDVRKHDPRCQVVPVEDKQVVFQIDGRECLRWHGGASAPRPFFYPIHGPSGATLTRMGHPGAANHDHHRSVWYAHHDVSGVDFWSDNTESRIRQRGWYALQDGGDEAVMGVELHWLDGHDANPLLKQEMIAALRPLAENEYTLELQATFTPTSATLQFNKTNFGFLAVRVAKSISTYFGGGHIVNSSGRIGEAEIFGHPAGWMDYSGPVSVGSRQQRREVVEGITYFDHAENFSYPSKWHVREDGWMGASNCRDGDVTTSKDKPLQIRHLLHIHSGTVQREVAGALAVDFNQRPPFVVRKGTKKHHQHEIVRA